MNDLRGLRATEFWGKVNIQSGWSSKCLERHSKYMTTRTFPFRFACLERSPSEFNVML